MTGFTKQRDPTPPLRGKSSHASPATPTAALSHTRAPHPQGLAAEWRAELTFVDKDVMLFYKKHERLT